MALTRAVSHAPKSLLAQVEEAMGLVREAFKPRDSCQVDEKPCDKIRVLPQLHRLSNKVACPTKITLCDRQMAEVMQHGRDVQRHFEFAVDREAFVIEFSCTF